MLKENKYYGEVWLRTSEDIKCFCILELIEDQVFLTTNLNDRYKTYQIELIYGMFTGLGYLTFVNCKIKHNSSGIIETTVYQPKYSFICAHHIIEPVNLKLKEFQVENAAIVQWVSKMTWYNAIDEKIEKQEDIVKKSNISKDLFLTITKSTSYTSNHDFFKMDNKGNRCTRP